MEIKETEVIRAAELLKQYCGEMDCTDCIFNYCGSCILHGSGYYGFYKPYNWSIDWIKGSWLQEVKCQENLTVHEVIEE